jgi:hypothetical protein
LSAAGIGRYAKVADLEWALGDGMPPLSPDKVALAVALGAAGEGRTDLLQWLVLAEPPRAAIQVAAYHLLAAAAARAGHLEALKVLSVSN